MVYLLIIFVPPTLAGGGFLSWRAGERFTLSQVNVDTPNSQSFASYATGTATLVGTYGLAEYLLSERSPELATKNEPLKGGGGGRVGDSGSTATKLLKKTSLKSIGEGYIAPQNAGEWLNRAGKPIALRTGAAAIAFFIAGMVQTYVANSCSISSDRSRS